MPQHYQHPALAGQADQRGTMRGQHFVPEGAMNLERSIHSAATMPRDPAMGMSAQAARRNDPNLEQKVIAIVKELLAGHYALHPDQMPMVDPASFAGADLSLGPSEEAVNVGARMTGQA